TGIGSYISLVLASFMCAIELGLSGAVPIAISIPAMVYWHLLIGIGEAIISALIIFYIYKVKPDLITTESIMVNKLISVNISKYKRPIISILTIIGTLILSISVGFTIGFLSNAPDGLERVLIDQNGEEWVKNLMSPWVPLLSWISNDYVAAIIGIILSIVIMISVFYLIVKYKKRNLTRITNSTKVKEIVK
ncbi:MAG: energy-coupling factor ABC transporter permease, partial [Promethearchaeota archaeon]